MEILDIKIDWALGWANRPRLKLLVDRIPKMSELRFKVKNNNYFAELDGYVKFFHYSAPDVGYGGSVFNIVMEDGTKKACKGPWSSRASAMNQLGFTPCVECAMTDERGVWKRGHTFLGCNVTIAAVEQALPRIAIDLAFDREGEECARSPRRSDHLSAEQGAIWGETGEINYVPTLRGMSWREAKQFMSERQFGFHADGRRFALRPDPWVKGGWKQVELSTS